METDGLQTTEEVSDIQPGELISLPNRFIDQGPRDGRHVAVEK